MATSSARAMSRAAFKVLQRTVCPNRGILPLPAALAEASFAVRQGSLSPLTWAGPQQSHAATFVDTGLTARQQRLDAQKLKDFLYTRYGVTAGDTQTWPAPCLPLAASTTDPKVTTRPALAFKRREVRKPYLWPPGWQASAR